MTKKSAESKLIIKNAFNKIASRLLSKDITTSNDSPLIYITSCSRQQGKSTISSLLAYYCALISDKKILLLDSNMDNPQIANLFGVTEQGLSETLSSDQGKINVQATDVSNLWVLPAGNQPDSTSLYMQHRVSKFIDTIKQQFDLILVDSSSVDANAGNSIAHIADGVVLVIDATSTRKADIDNIDQALNINKDKIIGAILNKHQKYVPNFIARLL
ncbi:MAG: CpsD/CapB family tyrosine-protein kinase [Arenicella sp.]